MCESRQQSDELSKGIIGIRLENNMENLDLQKWLFYFATEIQTLRVIGSAWETDLSTLEGIKD